MATYTDSLGLELITPGSQAGLWGNTTNNTFNLIDQAITGVTPVSFASASGTTYTLTDFNGAADEARAAVLNVTGSATGANTIVVPNKQKTYLVRNSTGQDVVFQTSVPNATYTVGAGYSILIFCDGNNNVFTGIASPGVGTLSVNAGGTGTTSFVAGGFIKSSGGTNALTASAKVNAATEISGVLPVASGGTGQSSLTSGALLVGNGTGNVAVLSGGSIGNVATWNGSTWIASPPTSGGVTSVFGRTGAITAQSGDYSSYYYPLSSNPSGYVTSSALSGYVTTTSLNSTLTSYVPKSGAAMTGGLTWGSTYGFSSSGIQVHPNNSITGISTDVLITATGARYYFSQNGNGTAQNGSWLNGSDQRLKENITPITSALSEVSQLNPVKFSYKSAKSPVADRYGLIAQDLEKILPDVVYVAGNEETPDLKAVAYTELVPVLIKAIQELKAEVDALKAAK